MIWATFENHWYLLLLDCSERREKETQKITTQKSFIEKHIVQQTMHRRQRISVDMLFFETQEIGCYLSLMKISYNLTKRTTKTRYCENYLKMYIRNFKTKSYELKVSGNIFISILNYKLKRLVSSLRLTKEQKRAKTAISRKKLSEKSVEGIKE